MDCTSTISSKGQITLPVEVRSRLGVKSGDKVKFVVEEGKTVVLPVREELPESFLEKWVGVLPAWKSREEMLAYYRDLRDDDEFPL